MEWWQAVAGARALGSVAGVASLVHDSRRVRPGDAFVALPGRQADGHDFLEAALAAGASALVVQADREAKWAPLSGRFPLVVVPDTRAALGPLAAAVHGSPAEKLLLLGVTGTDGKTTTTHLAAHVLQACGWRCGYLSSVGFDCGSGFEFNASHMTTLEAADIQARLALGVRAGLRAMALEASSEGLAQQRLEGCSFDVAIFTNLTRDHLDFHGSMENYRAAKGILFEMLDRPSVKNFPRTAILNADEAASAYMRTRTRQHAVAYGLGREADFRADAIQTPGFELAFEVRTGSKNYSARAPLIGRFNVYNCLAAVAAACSQGAGVAEAVEALASFPGVPGRLERIDRGQPFQVFVDIASTPAALENVLRALRPGTRGRLWAVFGAAGGRDPARREGMGRVAGRLADRCVLTNEDPREENPQAIIAAIARGLRAEGRFEARHFVRIPDRREAIAFAFAHAAPGDTVLLAGKATETTMVFGREHVPWDERAIAHELLGAERGGYSG